MGGGGGGGDPGAEARQQEAERQARIRAATDEINRIFNAGNRQALYDEQRHAVLQLNRADVDRQTQQALRQNRFGLARSGLMGGSVDVDSHAELGRRSDEGLLRAAGIADQAAADLRAADERTRANLIGMAQSGIDSTTAGQMALQNLQTNAQQVAQQRSGAAVGQLFDDLGKAYLAQQRTAGRTAGWQQGQQWLGVSSPHQRYQGSSR